MKITFFKIYRKSVDILLLPIVLKRFFCKKTGFEYKIGFWRKLVFLCKVKIITKKVRSATSWLEHILMAERVLGIPKNIQGAVAECGVFKGSSTASLSLACKLTGRKLFVFDSFKGLPEPIGQDKDRWLPHLQKIVSYQKRDYSGALAEVKENIRHFGCLEVCSFIEGYFEQTMPGFRQPLVFIFLDVDLPSSLEACLKHLWPLLLRDCFLFTHEAQDLSFTALFFNNEWWQKNLNCEAPGLIGAGIGLGYNSSFTSPLGYIRK